MQIIVAGRVHHGHAHTFGTQCGDALADVPFAKGYCFVIDQTHLALRLRLHHAHQVRIDHGCERVVLHAALIEQHIPREQIALEHGATVVRKGRGRDGEVCAQRVHQRLGHRANVALGRAVKGGAVFEIDLLGALRLQPL